MSKYIVTGGAGFIGSHVVEELVRKRQHVLVIDSLITGKKENIAQFEGKIEFIQDTIHNTEMLEREFAKADYIIHLAALPSVPRSIKDPVLSDLMNINGTLSVFEAAKRTGKKVVYASSSSVYGDAKELPKREATPTNPLSFYALQKLTDERYAAMYNKIFGCDFVGMRFFNVFGPRQDPKSEYAAVIPKFITIMSSGAVPTIFGDGNTSRDFTYVKNVVSALLLAAENKTEHKIFNVATGSSVSLNELIAKINKICGTDIQPIYHAERMGDIKHSLADITLAKRELDYYPKYSFDEGLLETARSIIVDAEVEKAEMNASLG